MLCSLSWLSDYVDLTVEAQELSDRLSMAGLESVVRPRYEDKIDGVVAAEILGVEKHPNADRLVVCTVESGSGQVEVVCGAPNARPGLKTWLALPGARLKGGFKIKKSKIRGVESFGMLCAEDELALSEDHTGIMELEPGIEPGYSLHEFIDFNDWLLEVDLTPNRGDCASVVGIAREVAALLGNPLRMPDYSYTESGQPAAELSSVKILDPDLCPRYSATLMSDLKVGPSPWWLKDRIISAGSRPISNLVDVTNFIMLEMNQPLHAFDFDNLEEHRIEVRRAHPGEKFVTLDGQERTLEPGMLLICDGVKPVGLAGVMGGLNSEIEETTTRVLLESAFFEPMGNRLTATRLGMSTEATYRFQRGMDPENTVTALKRATKLMIELGDGIAHPGVLDEYPLPWEQPRLPLRVPNCNRYIGIDLTAQEMADHLNSIEVGAEAVSDELVEADIPPWRSDLVREVDLTEEIARLHGYNNIPSTQPPMTEAALPAPPLNALRDRISPILVGAGLTQIVTFSFIPGNTPEMFGWSEDDPRFAHVPLLNPQSEEQSVLRTSLLFGLLSTLEYNLRHGAEAVRLFEWGTVFFPRGTDRDLPREEAKIGGVLYGPREPVSWASVKDEVDFHDLKGVVEELLSGLGLKGALYRPVERPEYVPGAAAEVLLGEAVVGTLGRLSTTVTKAFDLKREAYGFELSGDTILDLTQKVRPNYTKIPRYPSITRDIALVVKDRLQAGTLMDLVDGFPEPLIVEAVLFDQYQGKPLGDDEKSVGLRVRYQAFDRTLTEDEISPIHDKLTAHLIDTTEGRLRS